MQGHAMYNYSMTGYSHKQLILRLQSFVVEFTWMLAGFAPSWSKLA